MLNTYIKNRGFSKTIVHDSSNPYKQNEINAVNELNWDADYDGDIANISLTSNTNGDKKHFNISLDKNDLENILNVPSVEMPIHKRLKMDFSKPVFRHDPSIYKIELPEMEELQSDKMNNTLQQILDSSEPRKRYLSTPLPNEELIIPLSINKKVTPRRRHRHRKTHKTYRVYKKHKTHRKSTRKSSKPLTIF